MTDATPDLAALDPPDWRGATATPIAGDASARRYWRLRLANGETAILMDNRAPGGEGIDAFLRIADHLRRAGLAVPERRAASGGLRWVVTTDLGPNLLAAHLANAPADEPACFEGIAEVLAAVQAPPPPGGLARLTPETAAAMLDPLFEIPGAAPFAQDIAPGIAAAIAALAAPGLALSLRDFHAENILWRPGRNGTDRYGLIDFQDAFLAPPEYDLASLLRDARRAPSAEAEQRLTRRFAALTGRDLAAVETAIAVLAAQRNLRILGIFARLITKAGKPKYRAFLPVLTGHLRRDLAHPALAPIAGPALRLIDRIRL